MHVRWEAGSAMRAFEGDGMSLGAAPPRCISNLGARIPVCSGFASGSPEIKQLKIEYRDPKSLKSRSANPRKHFRQQRRKIERSIRKFGFIAPVLIDSYGTIICGHVRVAAAIELDQNRIPTVLVDALSEEQVRAYAIADNRLAEDGSWDQAVLSMEFEAILELDADFDLTFTGFEVAEIDFLLETDFDGAPTEETVEKPDCEQPEVSRLGDQWVLGCHRIMCGDVRDGSAIADLMGDDRARGVFTDPPYNVPIEGHVSGLGKVRHREFAMACGEMSSNEFSEFLGSVLTNLNKYSVDGALHFVCMDWRHIYELLSVARVIYSETKNLCVWNKDNGGMGSLY